MIYLPSYPILDVLLTIELKGDRLFTSTSIIILLLLLDTRYIYHLLLIYCIVTINYQQLTIDDGLLSTIDYHQLVIRLRN